MSAILTCVRSAPTERIGEFYCRLYVESKKTNEWRVRDIEVISEEGREISSEIESSLSSFIATTDDYFDCNEKDGKLICKGTVKHKTVEKGSWWERWFGE